MRSKTRFRSIDDGPCPPPNVVLFGSLNSEKAVENRPMKNTPGKFAELSITQQRSIELCWNLVCGCNMSPPNLWKPLTV